MDVYNFYIRRLLVAEIQRCGFPNVEQSSRPCDFHYSEHHFVGDTVKCSEI